MGKIQDVVEFNWECTVYSERRGNARGGVGGEENERCYATDVARITRVSCSEYSRMSARTLGDQTGHVVNVVHSPQNQCRIGYPNFHLGETLSSRSSRRGRLNLLTGGREEPWVRKAKTMEMSV